MPIPSAYFRIKPFFLLYGVFRYLISFILSKCSFQNRLYLFIISFTKNICNSSLIVSFRNRVYKVIPLIRLRNFIYTHFTRARSIDLDLRTYLFSWQIYLFTWRLSIVKRYFFRINSDI